MNKIKNFFSKISFSIKDVFSKYPITMIFCYITTIVFTFCLDLFSDSDIVIKVMMNQLLGIFFAETWFKARFDNDIKAVTTLGAILFFIIEGSLGVLSDIYELASKLLITTQVLFILGIIFYFIKKSEIDFKEYAFKVLINILKNSIVYGIFCIGILIIILIFSELILELNNTFEVISKIISLFFGFYYIPSIIYGFLDLKDDINKFVKGVVTFLCFPLIVMSIAIIYLYIVKLVLRGTFLKDSLFFILAFIYSCAYPIIILLSGIPENPKLKKAAKILAILYIPLIILEVLAMNVRVNEYGLTEERFRGYELIFIEIVSFILFFSKYTRFKEEKIFYVIAALILIDVLTPLSAEKISIISQENRITKVMKNVEEYWSLNDEDKTIVKGAYKYLYRSDNELAKNFINETFNDDILEDLSNIESDKTLYFYASRILDEINVINYKTIIDIDTYYNEVLSSAVKVDAKTNESNNISNIKIGNDDLNKYGYFDFSKIFEKIKIQSESNNFDREKFMEENGLLSDKEGKYDAILSNIDIRYDSTGKILYFSVNGYLLEK